MMEMDLEERSPVPVASVAPIPKEQEEEKDITNKIHVQMTECNITNTYTKAKEDTKIRQQIGQEYTKHTKDLKKSLHSLKHDVASSIRMCSRDFGVLGKELVGILQEKQHRELALVHALEHERKRRMKLETKLLEIQGNIRVICRVRPLLPSETQRFPEQKQVILPMSNQEVEVISPIDGSLYKSFSFFRVFGDQSTQKEIYQEIDPLVTSAVDGYHACIFAYGQTGSGKTHTMQGPQHDRGVYYRATDSMFRLIQEQSQAFDFTVTLQMVEIYNEDVYDLLYTTSPINTGNTSRTNSPTTSPTPNTNSNNRPIGEVRQGEHGRIYLKNVCTLVVQNAQQVFEALDRGQLNRSVFATNKNEHSSRSHSVLLLDIERKSILNGETHRGRLVLVDLAGSERVSKTDATGDRLKEAQYINKSLSAIGDVMSSLLSKDKHIPYRNSKLTHLLQDSLGFQSKTLMLVQVSPIVEDLSESINSLKFASRVSLIQLGTAKRNERIEIHRLHSLVTAQMNQISNLKTKLTIELDQRKKYEKRLEDYRHEEVKRKSREEHLKLKQQQRQGIGFQFHNNNTEPLLDAVALAHQQQQDTAGGITRRWSLYTQRSGARLNTTTSSSRSSTPTATATAAAVSAAVTAAHSTEQKTTTGFAESMKENMMTHRSNTRMSITGSRGLELKTTPGKTSAQRVHSHHTGASGIQWEKGLATTPLRRSRRLSSIMNTTTIPERPEEEAKATLPSSAVKRKTNHHSNTEVRSILKKQRGADTDETMTSSNKQVSFDMTTIVERSATSTSTVPTAVVASVPMATASTNMSTAPGRVRTVLTPRSKLGPAARVRTPGASTSSAFAVPATRVLSTTSSARKPKWNSSWR